MFEKKSKNNNGYFWNAFAGVVNAGEAVILSMAVTRAEGLAQAGVLSIAFAVGNLMMTVGKFGVRNYQVTDVQGKFTFSDYFWVRVMTVCCMIAISAGYLFYCVQVKGYDRQKVVVISAICLIYAIESMEDVFWGLYQQRQALDIGAKVFVFRWLLILAVFILLLRMRQGLGQAAVAAACVSVVAFLVCNSIAFSALHERIGMMHIKNAAKLVKQCFPLAAVAFMMFYVTNAPKYAIDRYLTDEVQACFGFIAMPVFVIEMLNGFIYQPSLVKATLEWKEGRVQKLESRARKQELILLAIITLCLAAADLVGIPVLSALYGTDLNAYKAEFLILLLGGGMFAYVGYYCVLLTIMRRQSLVMYGYIGVSVLAFFMFHVIVKYYGILGAAIFYTVLMTLLAVFFYFSYRRGVKNAAINYNRNRIL
ncbi:MAG: lipopolysaccharide biosynthesis protein [Eubacterium sp.]|nr:lipopolysaccharide biosynthesis protein [Eubacterium sp.]